MQQAYVKGQDRGVLGTAADWWKKKIGVPTGQDVRSAQVRAGASGYKAGLRAGPEQMSTGQASELAARKISQAAGKKVGAAADYASDVMKKGSTAFRRGMEDNPAGIGAAAVGAGLGALGLSKLLRRRRQAPA
jgi:hypothetical protein